MSHTSLRALAVALATISTLGCGSAALAQGQGGLLDGLFGGDRPSREVPSGSSRMAQMGDSEMVVRLERLENQIRQLTGSIEQLQFRNQQLEQQLRRTQEDNEFRFQELSGRGGQRPAAQGRPSASPPPQAAPAAPGRRSDVFDPGESPSAPGVPRTLGGGGGVVAAAPPPAQLPPPVEDDAPLGAPGGREAGAPLDLSTLAQVASSDPTLRPAVSPPPSGPAAQLPPPAPRSPNATGPAMATVSPPTTSPRDEYDLGYGYVLRKDYALAEQTFRGFLGKYPSDRMAPDAHYWLGESLFQRQRYREAAEFFLTVSTKYETAGKAPDSLLRLGQSLAALGEKETACAALGEIGRKYPRASVTVKQGVEREQKRVKC